MKRKMLLEFDLSQAEARAVAYYCGDERMKNLFKGGTDCHIDRAVDILKVLRDPISYDNFVDMYTSGSEKAKKLRQAAKAVGVHATNYDVGPMTVITALRGHGIYFTRKQEQELRFGTHNKFPGIRIYQGGVQAALKKTRTLKTAKGMSRYFFSKLDDNTFRRAYAYLPQCTVAEITNDAIVIAEPQLLELDSFILAQVHDSILVEVPERNVQSAYDICKKALYQPLEIYPFFGQSDILIIPSDCKYGSHWGELKSWTE